MICAMSYVNMIAMNIVYELVPPHVVGLVEKGNIMGLAN